MALKAGRVGVNPADVDPVSGHITGGSGDYYTKSQTDNKFETKSHASTTYATKTDAQPKQLEVPITMLSGSVLTTVEGALQGINGALGGGGLSFTKYEVASKNHTGKWSDILTGIRTVVPDYVNVLKNAVDAWICVEIDLSSQLFKTCYLHLNDHYVGSSNKNYFLFEQRTSFQKGSPTVTDITWHWLNLAEDDVNSSVRGCYVGFATTPAVSSVTNTDVINQFPIIQNPSSGDGFRAYLCVISN